MRWNAVVPFILLAFIAGCTTPAGLKTADDLMAKKDPIMAKIMKNRILSIPPPIIFFILNMS